ncbi:MAG: phosphoribosyl-ATP diphosphatase [Alphaproteobacteria bacterium]|nr:phosphoribosyl-ATP diphosphatase [Alphaproteobacteria bacterium]
MSEHILDRLYAVLEERKGAGAAESYVASLYAKGTDKIAGKIAEEMAETVIEAARGDKAKVASESADLLFHLMVLWAHMGVTPEDVFSVLETRFGTGGHAEKASRTS